jgi:hypothetical protein
MPQLLNSGRFRATGDQIQCGAREVQVNTVAGFVDIETRIALQIVQCGVSGSQRRNWSNSLILEMLENGIIDEMISQQEGILAKKWRRYAMLRIIGAELCDRNIRVVQRTRYEGGRLCQQGFSKPFSVTTALCLGEVSDDRRMLH